MRNPRAVVVDDSQFMRGLIADLLEEGGVPVVGSAANGAVALEVIRAERPDVVTMDVEMPEMDGLEAVDRIMTDCPTPVLMLSAYTADDAAVFRAEVTLAPSQMPGIDALFGTIEETTAVGSYHVVGVTETVPAERRRRFEPVDKRCRVYRRS